MNLIFYFPKDSTTPDCLNKLNIKRTSPRSLRPNISKRKLDLDRLIDQLPDKEFIAIKKTSLFAEKTKQNGDAKELFLASKKPLTEHQKEVRKQKTFIPLEVQSVFSATNDSQSTFAFDDDTNTQSSNFARSSGLMSFKI